eukprot:63745_1
MPTGNRCRMSIKRLPTLKQQRLLTEGYCRTNYIGSIPGCLIKSILLFYNEIFYWKFNGEKLKQFVSAKQGERIFSKPFRVNDLQYKYFIEPKSWIYGCIKQIPDFVVYSEVNIHVYSPEMYMNKINIKKKKKLQSKIKSKQFESKCEIQLRMMGADTYTNFDEINFYSKLEIIKLVKMDTKIWAKMEIKIEDIINNAELNTLTMNQIKTQLTECFPAVDMKIYKKKIKGKINEIVQKIIDMD